MRAAEFAAQLQQDPEYLANRAEHEKRKTDVEAAERQVLEYLASQGFVAASFADLLQRYSPIEADLADALVNSLGPVSCTSVIDSVVRALGAVRCEFDPSRLIELFEKTNSESIRWAIANTLAEARPQSAGQWILRSLNQSGYGKAREMLALAAARTNSPAVVNPELVTLLDELPGHAAVALSESGTTDELPALERAYARSSGWTRDELGRALAVIRARSRNTNA